MPACRALGCTASLRKALLRALPATVPGAGLSRSALVLGLSASAVLLTSSSSFSLGIARAGHGTALTRASVRLSARRSRLPPPEGRSIRATIALQ